MPRAHVSVINRPCFPNAVSWSDDNLLAVATSNTVVVLDAACLEGPRRYIEIGKQEVHQTADPPPPHPPHRSFSWYPPDNDMRHGVQVAPLMVDATPHDADNNLTYHLACLREQAATASAQALRIRPTTRSIAWSPSGCSPAGGCLLALTTEDGKVPLSKHHAPLCRHFPAAARAS